MLKFLRRTLFTTLTLASLALPALAQSTDPAHPTPWTGFGINAAGPRRDVTYYYSVPVNPGDMEVNLAMQANTHPGHLEVTFFDSTSTQVGRVELNNWRGPESTARRIRVARRQNLLMAVHVDGNVESEYSYWLVLPERQAVNIPRPEDNVRPDALQAAATGTLPARPAPTVEPSTWTERGSGSGANQELFYPITLYPGDLEISVTCQARVWSTSVALDIVDDAGIALYSGGNIATGSPTTSITRFRVTERRQARVRVRVDANCGAYNWSLTGALEH